MSKRTWLGCAVCTLALAACAGGAKQADSPGTCPEGTVLRGEDCVPPEAAGDDSKPSKSAKKGDWDEETPSSSTSSQGESDDKPSSSKSSTSSSSTASSSRSSSSGPTPYDKDAVEVQLKRAARQVKANCGSATDDEGKATGPWGSTKASVVLGRNGRVKGVTIPSPYDGRPVGDCVVHAFEKLVFPPYAGSSDVSVDWDIEITPPKHHR
jgi:hypothetical protein